MAAPVAPVAPDLRVVLSVGAAAAAAEVAAAAVAVEVDANNS